MDVEDIVGIVFGCITAIVFLIGMPWLILHYITKWKQAPKITQQDEALLDEMFQLSRRLEERLHTVERLVASDNPDWRASASLPEERQAYRLEGREDLSRERTLFRRETGDPEYSERSN